VSLRQGKPGGREDVVEVRVVGCPVKFAADLFRAGDKCRGVAGAAWGFKKRNVAAGDAAGGGDDFADAEASAVPEIVDSLVGVFKGAENKEMGLGQVVDVDVVTDAGAVGSGIVGAEDGDWACVAESGAENVRDEMGFGLVIFSVSVPSAGGIEIAQDGVTEPVNPAEPLKHDFSLQLGLAVGIDGKLGSVFGDRKGLREAKDGAGGRKDKAQDAVAETGFKKRERGSGVVAEIENGVLHGLGDFGKSGEVHDGVDRGLGEELLEEGGVGDIADNQARGRRDGRAMAAGEVIENGDLEIFLEEAADGGSADVASAAGDEDVLGHGENVAYQPLDLKIANLAEIGLNTLAVLGSKPDEKIGKWLLITAPRRRFLFSSVVNSLNLPL